MSGGAAAVFADRYRVVRRLGAGGSGAVFLAHDEVLSRDVALKRLHGAEVTAETGKRLEREARIMAGLRHPGLVTVYDMLTEADELLLVMEYVRGETLADVLADAPLEWERIAGPLEQIAAALDYVHDEGVIHRDLKPSNVLVASSGRVKIADLGLATAAEITNVTPPGTIVGTPAYMAPEQARAGPRTAAVDIFALGTIVFQGAGRNAAAQRFDRRGHPPPGRARPAGGDPRAPAGHASSRCRGADTRDVAAARGAAGPGRRAAGGAALCVPHAPARAAGRRADAAPPPRSGGRGRARSPTATAGPRARRADPGRGCRPGAGAARDRPQRAVIDAAGETARRGPELDTDRDPDAERNAHDRRPSAGGEPRVAVAVGHRARLLRPRRGR
jgi:predicted Ser/Thr protein kinase